MIVAKHNEEFAAGSLPEETPGELSESSSSGLDDSSDYDINPARSIIKAHDVERSRRSRDLAEAGRSARRADAAANAELAAEEAMMNAGMTIQGLKDNMDSISDGLQILWPAGLSDKLARNIIIRPRGG